MPPPTRIGAPAGEAAGEAARIDPARPASGVELIGEYRDSGLTEPRYLIRRGDGQVLQVSQLVYLVAAEIDGRRSDDEIAAGVGLAIGRRVSAANVRYLILERLAPAGLLESATPAAPPERASPLLGLRFRAAVLPPRAVGAVARALSPLFLPPVVLAALAALVALDVWVFAIHGVGASVAELIAEPPLLFLLGGLILASTAFHECGHAAACRYGGATPGAIGMGIYLIWPTCYTDVTDVYRLGRAGRLRTDLGGVYFNALFALGTGGAYLLTGWEPLLALILVEQLMILEQFVPWLRLDGYYVVSDLIGVPDAFAHIGPTLRRALPGRDREPHRGSLRPRARRAMLVYLASVVAVLALVLSQLALAAPEVLSLAWDSFDAHLGALSRALGALDWATAASEGLQVGLLATPAIGAALTTGLILHRGVTRLRGRRPVADAAGASAA